MTTFLTRTFLAALAAGVAATSLAGPGAAQTYGYGYGHDYRDNGGYQHDRYARESGPDARWDRGGDRNGFQSLNQRQQRLDWRIERGLRDGSLTRREARRLREEFREIAYLEARYRADGLSGWERADLDRRFDRLEYLVRRERRDDDFGYGYYR